MLAAPPGPLVYYAINKTFSFEFVNAFVYKSPPKMFEKLDALLKETKAWCDRKRGRQTELARALNVHRYTVNLWLRGKQKPTAESVLQLEAFMKHRRRK